MKTHIDHTSSTKKKIKLEIPLEVVSEAYKEAYKNIRKKANIPGFRKGKIPDHVLEQYYKPDLEVESLNILVEKTYYPALKEHDLSPLSQPHFHVDPLTKGKAYKYEVEVEVKPNFEVKKYKEVPLKKREIVVSEEELSAELKKLQESKAVLKPIEGTPTIEKGMVATIDFEGFVDGKAFSGGTAKNYPLEYGAGRFLKEFEDQMEGMKVKEERTLHITFPENYNEASLKGKKADFKVTIQALHSKELAKLDDELAKDIGKESLEALKKEITEMLSKFKEREQRGDLGKEAVDYLLSHNKFDLPEEYIKKQMENSKSTKEEVENSIRVQFILEAIAKKESIQVTPQELEARFQQLSQMYQQPAATIKKHYAQNQLVPQLLNQIGMEKTLDFVIDHATLE